MKILLVNYTASFKLQGPVVQKPVSLTVGKHKYSNQTFEFLAYEVEHVFPQIFSGSIVLSFYKVLKRTVLQKMNKPKR